MLPHATDVSTRRPRFEPANNIGQRRGAPVCAPQGGAVTLSRPYDAEGWLRWTGKPVRLCALHVRIRLEYEYAVKVIRHNNEFVGSE